MRTLITHRDALDHPLHRRHDELRRAIRMISSHSARRTTRKHRDDERCACRATMLEVCRATLNALSQATIEETAHPDLGAAEASHRRLPDIEAVPRPSASSDGATLQKSRISAASRHVLRAEPTARRMHSRYVATLSHPHRCAIDVTSSNDVVHRRMRRDDHRDALVECVVAGVRS